MWNKIFSGINQIKYKLIKKILLKKFIIKISLKNIIFQALKMENSTVKNPIQKHEDNDFLEKVIHQKFLSISIYLGI